MKKIVLKVVKQCVATDGVEPAYVKEEILPEYFRAFWVRRMALDRRNHKQVGGILGRRCSARMLFGLEGFHVPCRRVK